MTLPTAENFTNGYTEGLYTNKEGVQERVKLWVRGGYCYFLDGDDVTRALGRISVALRPDDSGHEHVLTSLELFG